MSALSVRGVSVELGGRNVVDGVSFDVERGEWLALIGPNGAGKSTLLRAIAGLVPYEGTIALDGEPTQRLRRRELARRIAVVPQVPLMPAAMSVREYVLLGRTPYVSYAGREGRHDHAAVEEALARLDLEPGAQNSPSVSRASRTSAASTSRFP